MRARHQRFADAFFEELQYHDVRTATINAGRKCNWCMRGWRKNTVPMTERQILRRARGIMERPDWLENMRDLFDLAGFSLVDAVKKHIEHIQTPTEHEPVGSFAALKAYEALVVPKATKRVEVDTRMLVAHRMVGDKPPETRARVLPSSVPAKSDGTSSGVG